MKLSILRNRNVWPDDFTSQYVWEREREIVKDVSDGGTHSIQQSKVL
jgi:hypothetical protein